MRLVIAWLTFLIAAGAPACSMSQFDPSATVRNTRFTSANQRFTVVLREYPHIADFGEGLAGDQPYEEAGGSITAAIYETDSRRLLRELKLSRATAQDVRITDSGRYLVGFSTLRRFCGYPSEPADPLLVIYSIEGRLIAIRTAGDVLLPYDIWRLNEDGGADPVKLDLTSDDGTISLLIQAPPVGGIEQVRRRRIDLATGILLDEKVPIWPQPRSYATPDPNATSRGFAQFEATNERVLVVPSATLFAQTSRATLPVFPIVALKARIRGTVRVEIVVGETGEVVSAKADPFAFGLDKAAESAARQWKFEPYFVDGNPVRIASDLLFHFMDVDEATWADIVRDSPPLDDAQP